MEDPTIHAVAIRGLGLDANGINQYEWLTEKQHKSIASAIAKGDTHVFIGGEIILVRDILKTKPMKLSYARTLPSFKPYVLEALEAEKQEAAKLANPEGKARLDALKAKHRLGQGGTC